MKATLEAKELRICNLVTDNYYESFKSVITVGSIHGEGINIHPDDDDKPYGLHSATLGFEYRLEDLQPIPLTEEWLVKFGFEQYNNTNHYYYSNESYIVKINSEFGYLFYSIDHKPIKYVHQLQNLYFSLTGEELEITKPL